MKKELSETKKNAVPIGIQGIGTRINEVSGRVGGKRSLANMVELSESQLHRIIAGESEPKVGVVAAIASAAGVSVEWLVTGKENLATSDEEYVYITKMDVEVSAGHGSQTPEYEVVSRKMAFRKDWLASRGLNERHLAIMLARGDSMEPTLPDGATLLIDTSKTDPGDGIYIIRVDGHLFAKRVQRFPDGSIKIKSDNSIYDPFSVEKDHVSDLDIKGKVVWYARDM